VLTDEQGHYHGIVPTAAAWSPAHDPLGPIEDLAVLLM
jgi:hypothetical protein